MPEKTELEQLREKRHELEQKLMAVELEKLHIQYEAYIKYYII